MQTKLLRYYAAAMATLLAGLFGYTMWYHAIVNRASWPNALLAAGIMAIATATIGEKINIRFAAGAGAAVVAAIAAGSAFAGGIGFYARNGEMNTTYAFHALLSPLIFCGAGYIIGLAVAHLDNRRSR